MDGRESGPSGINNDEDDLNLPRAALDKMIKEVAPALRVTNDARKLILACSKEFIHHISSEANDICNKNQKKTITHEHIVASLDSLGFAEFKAEAEATGTEAKAAALMRRRTSSKIDQSQQEELLRQQQELFAAAKVEQEAKRMSDWEKIQAETSQQLLAGSQGPIQQPVPSLATSVGSSAAVSMSVDAEEDEDDYN